MATMRELMAKRMRTGLRSDRVRRFPTPAATRTTRSRSGTSGPLAGWLTFTAESLLQKLIDADEIEVEVLGSVSQAISRGTLPKLSAKARAPRYKGICGSVMEAEVLRWADRPIQQLLKTSTRERDAHPLVCQLLVTLELSSEDLRKSLSSSTLFRELLPDSLSGNIVRAQVTHDAVCLEREKQKSVLLRFQQSPEHVSEISLVILELPKEEEVETKSWKLVGAQVHSIEYKLDCLKICAAVDVTS